MTIINFKRQIITPSFVLHYFSLVPNALFASIIPYYASVGNTGECDIISCAHGYGWTCDSITTFISHVHYFQFFLKLEAEYLRLYLLILQFIELILLPIFTKNTNEQCMRS